ncbi:unnamed protein product [Ilex paraguariensis]|uniref:Uncharacterized protein n=1 Tax=Ilex paraguariensis TaxID=185542 RepID=A0ABC8V5K5_9AQUA
MNLREFWVVHEESKARGFGRVFRSPTLFEDMFKCILLCNWHWPRTLSMAAALCELQLELPCPFSSISVAEADNAPNSRSHTAKTEHFTPKTPARKESKRELGVHKGSTKLAKKLADVKVETEGDAESSIDCVEMTDCLQKKEKLCPSFLSSYKENFHEQCDSHQTSSEIYQFDSSPVLILGPLKEQNFTHTIRLEIFLALEN